MIPCNKTFHIDKSFLEDNHQIEPQEKKGQREPSGKLSSSKGKTREIPPYGVHMEYRQKKGLSLKWLNPLLFLGGRHRDRTCDFFRVKEALSR